MKKKLYALFVGINDYPSPVSKLGGCIKDVDNLEKFVKDHLAGTHEINIKRLIDKEATYEQIITTFRSHLGQAESDDVVWFHYSGHGSEETTAEEFKNTIEPSGKDQTLVVYNARLSGGHHLADKELAVLLHELTENRPEGPPHIVVSLDACHSGSGTRDHPPDLFKTRAAPSSGGGRTLDSYVDGYYSAQWKAEKRLSVPVAPHIAFSACETVQLAGDLSSGGAFSSGLVGALRKTRGDINYADLFLRARSSVQKINRKQTPQFETIGSFNPYTKFLEGSPHGSPDMHEVRKFNDGWYIMCGAVHGLPTQFDEPIEIEIWEPIPDNELKGLATIVSVGAQKSKIDRSGKVKWKQLLDMLDPGADPYRGVIKHLPAPPVAVWVHGDPNAVAQLTTDSGAIWDHSKNIIPVTETTEPKPNLEVLAEDGHYRILDHELGKQAYATNKATIADAKQIMQSLERIVRWRRTVALANQDPKSRMPDLFRFELLVHDTEQGATIYSNPDIKIYPTPDNSMEIKDESTGDIVGHQLGFQPQVVFKPLKQRLYFYVFHLRSNYSILSYEGEVVYIPADHPKTGKITLPMWTEENKEIRGWGPDLDENETKSYFKLIATSEQLDYHTLEQMGLGDDRDSGGRAWGHNKIFNDWTAKMIAVTLVWKGNNIQGANAVELGDGKLIIRPHESVKAGVSLANAPTGTRNGDPGAKLTLFDSPDMEMLHFNARRDLLAENILELNDLEIHDPGMLVEHPLQIDLALEADDDLVVALTFDGDHFKAIGTGDAENDKTTVKIGELPSIQLKESPEGMVASPFDETPQDRSLFSAMKMAFFKVVLKREDAVHTLRWAEPASMKLHAEGLRGKVSSGKRILLLVPGLFGDSDAMLKPLVEGDAHEEGQRWIDQFDSVLTFDYENLNTPLDQSADKLKQALETHGLHENEEAHVVVIGHGIGGLVARWLIERQGGNQYIDHLILVGVPNDGSPFGKIDQARSWSTTVLDFAINFVPNIIPFSGYVLKFLKNVGELTGTLGDVATGSNFLSTLNQSPDPGISYTLIAGDARDYEVKGGGVKRFFEKTQLQLGALFQGDRGHDTFSSVTSAQNINGWKNRTPEPQILPTVTSHHYSYFTNPDVLEQLATSALEK
ncbi:MAG: hypothetical protein HKN87_21620 [Saprospiraceae bacterium]|nr:hypothetical protein [Saprospiraceae bacterium]